MKFREPEQSLTHSGCQTEAMKSGVGLQIQRVSYVVSYDKDTQRDIKPHQKDVEYIKANAK